MRDFNQNSSACFSPYYLIFSGLLAISFIIPGNGIADSSSWRFKNTFHTYAQTYSGDADRSSVINAGYFLSADYLDSANIGLGYTSTVTNFGNNLDDSGELLYFSAQRHLYPDSLPGKLGFRGAIWQGEDQLKLSGSGQGSSRGILAGKRIRLDSGFFAETTDIDVYYAEISFLNYSRSFYADAGYAYSEYDNSLLTKVDQFTPTLGVGWNQSHDWLQLKIYLIDTDEQLAASNEGSLESLELKYTHWYADESSSNIEFVRLTGLIGDRKLAVDPDTAAIYSIVDAQDGSLAISIQWKFSAQSKVLTSIQYDRYEDDRRAQYDSVLFYINFQFQT